MRNIMLLTILLLAAAPIRAIELEVRENREQRGNIGFVDMQKVFKAFPETVRAKENFEELVRQAEEQVNLRKAELLRLRGEVAELKGQRDLVSRTIIVAPPPAPPPAEEKKPEPPKPAPPPAKSTGAAELSLPGLEKFVEAKKPEPLIINIPGVSTAPLVVQPPAEPKKPEPPVVVSTVPAAAAPVAVASGTAPAPLIQANPALAELDAKIALKSRELAQKEGDFKDFQASQEKSLLDLEGRRTEIILGKISKAIQEVAHQEGVSVVVDKSNIVFGHGAVDLTDKVLKHLQGAQP